MKTINIVGIDPGSNDTGISTIITDDRLDIVDIITYNVSYKNIVGHNLNIITPNNAIDLPEIRISTMMERIKNILLSLNPTYVGIESPFISPRAITAAKPLHILNSLLKNTLTITHPNTEILTIPPTSVKSMIGTENSKKISVTEALRKTTLNKHVRLDDLTEHEIDGLAISLILLNLLRTAVDKHVL